MSQNDQPKNAPAIPKSITRDQLADANIAFCKVLGINAYGLMLPMVITEDAIMVNAVASPDYGAAVPEGVPAIGHPQGDEFAELAVAVSIRVRAV